MNNTTWFGLDPAVFLALAIPTVTTLWRFIIWLLSRRTVINTEFVQLGLLDRPSFETGTKNKHGLPNIELQIQIQNMGTVPIWIRQFNIYDDDTKELLSPSVVKEQQSNIPLFQHRNLTYLLPQNVEKKYRVEVVYARSQKTKFEHSKVLYLNGYMLGLYIPDYPAMKK